MYIKLINTVKNTLLLFFILSPVAWGAYPNYTICPTGGGCDFTFLQAAVNDMVTNHATLTSPVTITISGTWSSMDTTAVNITGITTTSSNIISIIGNNATGIWNTNDYILSNASTALTIGANYVTVSGLQINPTGNSGSIFGIYISGTNETIENNIIKGTGNGNQQGGILLQGDGVDLIYNNVIYYLNFQGGIKVDVNHSFEAVGLYNNTVYSCSGTDGFQFGTGNVTLINNISNANGTDYGSGASTTSTNISDDATSPDGTSYQGANGTAAFVNTTVGSENFNLKSTDTAATGRGTTESSTFTTDITGATRSVPWDIGAFKSPGAPVAPPTIIIKTGTINGGTLN